jgi:RNA polymerase sigma factor (sigma-70 family)
VNYADHSDEQLLGLFYQGDDRAYEELDHRHRNRLAGLARWRLDGWGDADERAREVTQETLLRVVRTRNGGLSPWQPLRGPVRPWLDTILDRCITDLFRREGRQLPTVPLGAADEEGSGEPAVPGHERSPQDQAEEADLFRWCVQTLPAPLGTLVEMKFRRGMQQNQIAAALGLSNTTVSVQLDRALNLLRARLKGGKAR